MVLGWGLRVGCPPECRFGHLKLQRDGRPTQTEEGLDMIEARAFIVVALITIGEVSGIAKAQTPINAPGAMQPSTGTGVYHIMPMYREIGSDPTSNIVGGREYIVLSQIAYGVSQSFSLQID